MNLEAGSPPRLAVLMGTFNGARYLRAQLDSLLGQSLPLAHLLVRDDGSNDATLAILDEYQEKFGTRLQLIRGENLGFVANFFTLIQTVSLDFDYYLFADQDDVWLEDKLARAARQLDSTGARSEFPCLYFSRLALVDAELQPLGLSALPARLGLGNALFENPVTGCSAAVNKGLLKLLRSCQVDTRQIVAHDWWLYLVASAFAHLVYDPKPSILYRQHGANSMGGHPSPWRNFWRRVLGFYQGKWAKRRPEPMVAQFYQLYAKSLSEDQSQLIRQASLRTQGFLGAFRLWRQRKIWRARRLDRWIMLLLLCQRGLRLEPNAD